MGLVSRSNAVAGWYRSLRSQAKRRSQNLAARVCGSEWLEPRLVLSVEVTPLEQYFLELMNRARANPTAEAQRYGLSDLNQGLSPGTITATPKAPLATNQLLLNAAAAHSNDMFTRNFFDHTNPDGVGPGDRIAAAGYVYTTWGENIAYYSEGQFRTPTAAQLEQERNDPVWAERHHQGLFESPGHRTNLLRDSFKEVGPSVIVNASGNNIISHATQNFGTQIGNSFLLGVVFQDTVTADQFYTIGEGRGGVTIVATSQSGQQFTTTTASAGGYELRLPNGTYTVVASGAGLAAPITRTGISVSGANVKTDFITSAPVNQPPVGSQPAIGVLTVLQQGAAGTLFPAAAYTDADSTTTGGGSVVVTLASAVASDRLTVASQGNGTGQIGVSGSQVSFGGNSLGTISGGTGTTPLSIALVAGATPQGVQALLRSIQFASTASSPTTAVRTATAVITDGGGNSASISRSVQIAPLAATETSVRFQRAYNPNADYHFFTTSTAEFNNAVSAGYRDETTGQPGFMVSTTYASGTALIHRLYNLATGRHYYTVSDGERDGLVKLGWKFEKDEGFMHTVAGAGLTEVFRLYNRNSGVHLYSENQAAKDAVLAAFPGVWEQHSSLGFATGVGAGGVTRSLSALAAAATAEQVVPTVESESPPGVSVSLVSSAFFRVAPIIGAPPTVTPGDGSDAGPDDTDSAALFEGIDAQFSCDEFGWDDSMPSAGMSATGRGFRPAWS